MDNKNNDGWGNPDRVAYDIINSYTPLIDEALRRRIGKMGGLDIAKVDDGALWRDVKDKEKFSGRFISQYPMGAHMGEYHQKKIAERTYKPMRDEQGKAIDKVLIKKNAPTQGRVAIDRNLVNKSESGFNPVYRYGIDGAEPADPKLW